MENKAGMMEQADSEKITLKKRFKKTKRFIRYCILRTLYWLASKLPLSAAKAIGRGLCKIGVFIPSIRKKALAGLAVAFPEKSEAERLQIIRKMFDYFGDFIGEVCCIDTITPRINSYVELPEADRETYEGSIHEGKGLLVVTGHVGNFELMARRLGLIGYPSNVVAKVSSDPHMTAFIDRFRRNGGYKMIWRGQGPRGSAFQAIRDSILRGEATGLLIDQDTKGHGRFVDFFGKKAFTPSAAADLAIETRCAVITAFIHSKPGGGHIISTQRIPLPDTGDHEADAQQLLQTLTKCIEDTIRTEPHAWPWFHERWKHRPPEETDSGSSEAAGSLTAPLSVPASGEAPQRQLSPSLSVACADEKKSGGATETSGDSSPSSAPSSSPSSPENRQ